MSLITISQINSEELKAKALALSEWLDAHFEDGNFIRWQKNLKAYEKMCDLLNKRKLKIPGLQKPYLIQKDINGNWFNAGHFNGTPGFKQLKQPVCTLYTGVNGCKPLGKGFQSG